MNIHSPIPREYTEIDADPSGVVVFRDFTANVDWTDIDAIVPPALLKYRNCAPWRAHPVSGAKLFYNPNVRGLAKSNNLDTTGTWDQAKAKMGVLLDRSFGMQPVGGLGILVGVDQGDGTSIGGLDLDSCKTDGVFSPWATEIIGLFKSYVETSPSGDGAHTLFRYRTSERDALKAAAGGSVLWRGAATNGGGHSPGIEFYLDFRFFTVSGSRVGDCRDLPIVSVDTVERLSGIAAKLPRIAGGKTSSGKRTNGVPDRSAMATSLLIGLLRANANLTFDAAMEALAGADEPLIAEWYAEQDGSKAGARQLQRHWDFAVEKSAERRPRDFALTEEPPPAVKRFTADEARAETERAIGEFFARVETPNGSPPMHAIRVDLGVGKSSLAREEITRFVRRLRANGDKRSVVIAVPTHRLGAEAALKFPEDIRVGIWRGREAADPDRPGETMCQNIEAVIEAQAILATVEKTCCRRSASRTGAPEVRCGFYDTCAYQAQKRVKADVWFTAHETLFTRKPKVTGEVAAIVVDESPRSAGIRAATPLSMGALENVTPVFWEGREDTPTTNLLIDLRKKLLRAFGAMPDGPVTRGALKAARVTGDDASGGYQLEWLRKREPDLHPGMTPQEWETAVEATDGNRTINKFAMMWKALRALLDASGPEVSGWIELDHGTDSERIIRLRSRKELAKGFAGVPTLVMDANLRIELLEHFWPGIELTANIAVAAPYQHVQQVIDENFGKNRLVPKKETNAAAKRRRDLRAIVNRFGRQYWPEKVLVVAQKDVEETLTGLGPNVMTAHHNAVAGLDKWRDVRALMMIGRTAPGPLNVERIAMALTGRAVPSVGVKKWYPSVIVPRETRSGELLLAVADRHPDPIAEAIRWQICEGELMQIIGRPRGVNREATTPVDIWVLTDVLLPIPVDEALRTADLAPTAADLMLAEGGIAFTNPTDASLAYPELWGTRKDAKNAFEREVGLIPLTVSVYKRLRPTSVWSYQRTGAGKRPATALVDETSHADPAAAIAAKLGRVRWVKRVEPR